MSAKPAPAPRYARQVWVDGTTPVDAAHMNHLEDGVIASGSQLSGWVGADGSIYSGAGFTITRPSVGLYEIRFNVSFASLPYVFVIPQVGGGPAIPTLHLPVGNDGVDIHMWAVSGAASDCSFLFRAWE
jgi:hypothetical protein